MATRLWPGCRVGVVQHFNLGDVVATLPIAGVIKQACPTAQVVFIGRRYAEPVVRASRYVDEFLDSEAVLADAAVLAAAKIDILVNPFPHREIAEAAYRAKVPVRIGNLMRGKYVRWCNRFVMYAKQGTGLHEAQLNLRDLRALGLHLTPGLGELAALAGVDRLPPLDPGHRALLDPARFKLLLHAKSQGNGREWPAENYLQLARSLHDQPVQVLLTGTAADGEKLQAACPELLQLPNVLPTFGRFTLPQFLAVIAASDGLIAAGTGPVHLAAVLGRHALGIYPARRGIQASRWAPLGPRGEALQAVETCTPRMPGRCPKHFGGGACWCTRAIDVTRVRARVLDWVQASRA